MPIWQQQVATQTAAINEQPQSPVPSVHKSNRNKDRTNNNNNNHNKNNINNKHKNRSNNTALKHNQ